MMTLREVCGIACQRAARFGATVLPRLNGRLRRPATARRIHIRRRVAVLPNPPRPDAVRPAAAPKRVAHGTSGGVRLFGSCDRSRSRSSSPVSRREGSPSASRCVVAGYGSLPRLRLTAPSPNRRATSRSTRHGPPARKGFTQHKVFSSLLNVVEPMFIGVLWGLSPKNEELEFRVGVGELVLSLLFVRCPVASEVVDASVVADGGGAREEQPHG